MRNKRAQWEPYMLIFATVAVAGAVIALFVPPLELKYALISASLGVLAIGLGINSVHIARHTDSVVRHIDEVVADANARIEEIGNRLPEALDTSDKQLEGGKDETKRNC